VSAGALRDGTSHSLLIDIHRQEVACPISIVLILGRHSYEDRAEGVHRCAQLGAAHWKEYYRGRSERNRGLRPRGHYSNGVSFLRSGHELRTSQRVPPVGVHALRV